MRSAPAIALALFFTSASSLAQNAPATIAAPPPPEAAPPRIDEPPRCEGNLTGRYVAGDRGDPVYLVRDDGTEATFTAASAAAMADGGAPSEPVTLHRAALGLTGEATVDGLNRAGAACRTAVTYAVARCDATSLTLHVTPSSAAATDCLPTPGTGLPVTDLELHRGGADPSGSAYAPGYTPVLFFGTFTAGPGYRRLYDVNMAGLDLSFRAGLVYRGFRAYGLLEGLLGSTEYGLHTTQVYLAPGMDYAFGAVRLGLGARLGLIEIDRATSSSPMTGLSLGGFVSAEADLIQRGPLAVYVGAKFGPDILLSTDDGSDSPILWGGDVHLGLRYQ